MTMYENAVMLRVIQQNIYVDKSWTAITTSFHMMVPGHMMRKATVILAVMTAELEKVCRPAEQRCKFDQFRVTIFIKL